MIVFFYLNSGLCFTLSQCLCIALLLLLPLLGWAVAGAGVCVLSKMDVEDEQIILKQYSKYIIQLIHQMKYWFIKFHGSGCDCKKLKKSSFMINVYLTFLQDFFSIIPWNLYPPTTPMATPLDMSLEDVIKKNNREKLRARGRARRGRGAGGSFNGGRGVVIGSVRRGPLGINTRASANSIRKASFKLWCLMHMLENLIFLENTCSRGFQITL